jgi:hypothetical protein
MRLPLRYGASNMDCFRKIKQNLKGTKYVNLLSVFNITILFVVIMATVGMFDWRLFDNSNRTKVVRRPKKLGCLTQIMFDGKLTIVEHKINRTKSE